MILRNEIIIIYEFYKHIINLLFNYKNKVNYYFILCYIKNQLLKILMEKNHLVKDSYN